MADDEVVVELIELDYEGRYVCVLAMVCESYDRALSFVDNIERVLFPPGGRGSSQLTLTSAADGTLVDYEAYSDGGTLHFSATTNSSIANTARRSLESAGAVVLIFGYSPGATRYLPASDNCLVRTSAILDGELVGGTINGRFDWNGFLSNLDAALLK